MSLMCDCPRCGGNDDFAMCENGLLEAQLSVHRSQRKLGLLNFLLGALVVLFLLSLALPSEEKTQEAGATNIEPSSQNKDKPHES